MARLAFVLLVLTAAAIGVLYYTDYHFTISEDEAVQRDVRHAFVARRTRQARERGHRSRRHRRRHHVRRHRQIRGLAIVAGNRKAVGGGDVHGGDGGAQHRPVRGRIHHRRGHLDGRYRRRGDIGHHGRRRRARHRQRRQQDGRGQGLQRIDAGAFGRRRGGHRGHGGHGRRRRGGAAGRLHPQSGEARGNVDRRFRADADAAHPRGGSHPGTRARAAGQPICTIWPPPSAPSANTPAPSGVPRSSPYWASSPTSAATRAPPRPCA